MANCICNKCGAEANSKNPMTRHVFAKSEAVDMAGHFIGYNRDSYNEKNNAFSVTFYLPEKGENPELQVADRIRHIVQTCEANNCTLEQFFCEHNWELKPGEIAIC